VARQNALDPFMIVGQHRRIARSFLARVSGVESYMRVRPILVAGLS
jgi:hypothetical protein